MTKKALPLALKDIISGLTNYSLVFMLGWQDVKQRYKRSALGPFWLTISMGVMIGSIGFVFGQIFNTSMSEFLPFLAIGLIIWSFILAVANDGCVGFISAEQIIKQVPMPLFVHVLRIVWRNILILMHNMVIFPITLLVFGKTLDWFALVAIVGLFLLILNLTWIALLLAVLCARYRDLPQMVSSILQVLFYLTPIIWMPSLLPDRAGMYLLDLNPLYHLLAIVRDPLLGNSPTFLNWQVSMILAAVGWTVVVLFYSKYRRRIAYWL
jgi:ABC-type polysaccharide/polyol phosphate export permease